MRSSFAKSSERRAACNRSSTRRSPNEPSQRADRDLYFNALATLRIDHGQPVLAVIAAGKRRIAFVHDTKRSTFPMKLLPPGRDERNAPARLNIRINKIRAAGKR